MNNGQSDFSLSKARVVKIGHSNAILDCRFSTHNRWLEIALKYLPEGEDIITQNGTGLLITSTATRDACRVARKHCQSREIILISERVLPSENVKDEMHPKARYFIYVVLHELVHVLRAHKSPYLDNLTNEEHEAQEAEADNLALKWFNNYIEKKQNKFLLPITKEEITLAQKESQVVMKRLLDGV